MTRASLQALHAVVYLRPVIAVALAAALTGCLFQDKVEAFTGPTMGSTYTIKYVRSGDVPAKEVLHGEVEAILADLKRRDAYDSTRKEAPLRAAEDAHHIDSSNLGVDEVVAKVMELIDNAR